MLNQLLVVLVPAGLWIAYLYYKDRLQPEPPPAILLAYLLGVLSGWSALGAFDLIDSTGIFGDPMWLIQHDTPGFLVYALVVIGPVEELVKLLPFALVCVKLEAFDERIDGIVYASTVALGFASTENFINGPFLEDYERYAMAISLPLVHMVFSSCFGHAYARAHFDGKSVFWYTFFGWLIASFAHGLYDFLTLYPGFTFGSTGVILVVWMWKLWTLRRLHNDVLIERGEEPI